MADVKRLTAYGATATASGYEDAAEACEQTTGGEQLDALDGNAIYAYVDDGNEGTNVYLAKVPLPTTPGDFYGQTEGFENGQKVYVTAQDLEGNFGEIDVAGYYNITLDGGFANNAILTTLESANEITQPTECAESEEEINFTTGTYAPNYVTSSITPIEALYTYGVIRTDASAAPLVVEIDISASSTAVADIDYTRPANSALTLSWSSETNGTETFNVGLLVNPAYTASTFIPYIRSSSIASIVGTASYASSNIIYPGTLDFTSAGDTVNEGQSQETTITRSSGSDEAVTLVLTLTGTAVYGSDYTLTDLTKDGDEATASFGDGEDEYSFTINTIANPARSGSTLNFAISDIDYPISGTQFYVSAKAGVSNAYILTINNYDTGSLKLFNADGVNIYTASMPVTWSVDRYSGSDGAVTATIDLMVSGGYATGVFGTDYTGAYGSFPITLTWADGADEETLSIQTLANSALTGVSISPYISSASVRLETSVFTSSAAWIAYPGLLYVSASVSEVLEGASYTQNILRASGSDGLISGTLTFGGTAVSGTDYTFTPPDTAGNIWALADGAASTALTVITDDDAADEDNETIIISLSEGSGTQYTFTTTGDDWSSGFAFNTGSLFTTPLSNTTTIIDNESGSANFSVVSSSVSQASNIIITIIRASGSDLAATATIDKVGGTAVADLDYSGLPATVYWENQVSGNTTFSIATIGNFRDASTLYLGFTQLTNLYTGNVPTASISITNDILTQSVSDLNDVDGDYTINNYRKISDQYTRRTGQVPVFYTSPGVVSLRFKNAAYTVEMGAGTGSKTS